MNLKIIIDRFSCKITFIHNDKCILKTLTKLYTFIDKEIETIKECILTDNKIKNKHNKKVKNDEKELILQMNELNLNKISKKVKKSQKISHLYIEKTNIEFYENQSCKKLKYEWE